MRLSFGEMDWPDDYSKVRSLRALFLEGGADLVPDVCEELYAEPLVLFGRLTNNQRKLSWKGLASGSSGSSTNIRALIDALYAWSDRWGLDRDWCRESAYESLQWLCRQPGSEQPQMRFHPHLEFPMRHSNETLPPPDGLDEYWPLLNSRQDYLQQFTDRASEKIAAHPILKYGDKSQAKAFVKTIIPYVTGYCIEVEEYLLNNGYRRPKAGEKRKLAQHMEWAVRYQLTGLGWSEIAELNGVQASAVQQAVTHTMKVIDLPLRKIAKGRPPGSKDSPSASIRRKLGR